MQGYRVAEVRGIEKGQNMEVCMYDIVNQKLEELPGGEKWKRVAQSMQHLSAIYNNVASGNELDAHDILFLRQYGGKIETFGYRDDPRVAQLLHGRDESQDLRVIIRQFGSEVIAKKLLQSDRHLLLLKNFEAFDEGSVDVQTLITKIGAIKTIEVIDRLPIDAIDQPAFVRSILEDTHFNTRQVDVLLENQARFDEGAIDFVYVADILLKTKGAEWLLVKYADILPVPHLYDQLLDSLFCRPDGLHYEDHHSPLRSDRNSNEDSEAARAAYWSTAIMASPNPLAIARRFASESANRQPYLITHATSFIKAIGRDRYAQWLLNHKLEVQAAGCLNQLAGSIDHDRLAATLFDKAELGTLADNLQRFHRNAVDHGYLVKRLLATPKGGVTILRNLTKFTHGTVDGLSLYQHLLDQKRGNAICEHVDQLTAVADIKQIVADLASTGMISSVGKNFKYIANQYGLEEFGAFLAQNGGAVLLRTRLSIFKGLLKDDEVVGGLIREGRADLVFQNFAGFELTHYTPRQIVLEAIGLGQGDKLSSKFVHIVKVVPIKELQDILLSNPGGELLLIRHIARFTLGQEACHQIVTRLCKDGHVDEIGKNMGRILDTSDHTYLARTLIENGGAAVVARNRRRFAKGSIDKEALHRSLEQGNEYEVLQDTFGKGVLNNVEPNAYIAHLLRRGKVSQALAYLADASDDKLDRKAVFNDLVRHGKEDQILEHPELFMRFDGSVDKARLADVLLRNDRALEVAENVQSFGAKNVDANLLVKRLVEAREVGALLKCFGVLPPGSIDPLRLVRIWSLFGAEDMSEQQLSKLLRVGGAIDVAEMLMQTGSAHFIEKRLDAFLKYVKPAAFAGFLEEAGFGYMIDDHEVLTSARSKMEDVDFDPAQIDPEASISVRPKAKNF